MVMIAATTGGIWYYKSIYVSADGYESKCLIKFASNKYVFNRLAVSLSGTLGRGCKEYNQKIPETVSFSYRPVTKIKIFSFKNEGGKYPYSWDYPAYSLGGITYFNIDQYDSYKNNIDGLLIHEMTHNFQHYNSKISEGNSWVIEGLATYVDKKITNGEPNCMGNENIFSGYGCTARFFYYLEYKYPNAKVHNMVNFAMQNKNFDINMFKKWTGKTINELQKEFEYYKFRKIPKR